MISCLHANFWSWLSVRTFNWGGQNQLTCQGTNQHGHLWRQVLQLCYLLPWCTTGHHIHLTHRHLLMWALKMMHLYAMLECSDLNLPALFSDAKQMEPIKNPLNTKLFDPNSSWNVVMCLWQTLPIPIVILLWLSISLDLLNLWMVRTQLLLLLLHQLFLMFLPKHVDMHTMNYSVFVIIWWTAFATNLWLLEFKLNCAVWIKMNLRFCSCELDLHHNCKLGSQFPVHGECEH